ncbi:MAG: DUF3099 domain-containing protein [Mycobacteriales bacterium]|nr:DUF3099 domain-containing protein [Mycobacteriales bacterium]
MSSGGRARTPAVTSVTTAALSHADDMRLRQKRYLITQAVRVSCVLLAVLLPVGLWWKAAFIVGSIVLPWMGVVSANAGPTRSKATLTAVGSPTTVTEPLRSAIEPGRVVDQAGHDVA